MVVWDMDMSIGSGDLCRDWIQDPDNLKYDLNTHPLNEQDDARDFLEGGRTEERCCSNVHKLPGVLWNVQSKVCKVETVCEFGNRCEFEESIVVGNGRGKCLISLAFLLLFGLSTPSTTSAFLLVVFIGILLSGIPAIGSRLSVLFLFAFVRCMLLLLGGKRQISRLRLNGR